MFSFSESERRLDFFGEEVDSIRRFEISSQLSADRLNEVEIVPNLNGFAGDRISLPAFAGEVIYWFFDPDYVLRRVNDLRRKVLGEVEPAEIDTHLVSRKVLLQDMAGMRLFELRDSLKERPADAVAFRTAPQPKFNKNFEIAGRRHHSATPSADTTPISCRRTGRSSSGWRTSSTRSGREAGRQMRPPAGHPARGFRRSTT